MMKPSTEFWDKIAEKYAKQSIADEAFYQKKLQITQEYFEPNTEVLEFGCGTGSTAITHAPYVKHIQAIDISKNMIAIANRKAEAQNIDNITFEQLTIEELEIEDRAYDVVLGMSILHLLKNKEKAIAKAYQMLKSGGVFVTSTMCMGDSMKWFKLIAPIGRFFGFFPLVKVFTSSELLKSIKDTGFARQPVARVPRFEGTVEGVIDYQWQPSKNKAMFIVAKKPN